MFAVIKTGGKQYKVAKNDIIKVEKIAADAGDTVAIEDVLMVGDGKDITVGTPFVKGAAIAAEILEQGRGTKIIVFKKRRRQNSRRRNGHRQDLTVLKITDILTDGKKVAVTKKAVEPKKAAPKKAEAKKEAPKAASKPKAEPKAEPKTAEGIVDDVSIIGGVGPKLQEKLAEAGVTSLTQIAKMSDAEAEKLDTDLDLRGRVTREEWVEQAKELLAGKPPRAKTDQKAAAKKKD